MLVNEPDYEPIHQSALLAAQSRGQWVLRVAEICKLLMGKRSLDYASLVPLHAFGLQWPLIG
jgi:hypothetical protein